MPITPTALASELNTDPVGLGYAALVAAGNDAGCAAKLNTPTATLGFRNDIKSSEIVNAVVAWQVRKRRKFPTFSEILGIVRGLGYAKAAAATEAEA